MPHRNKNKKQNTDNFSFFEVIGESLSCQGAGAKNLYCEAAYILDKDTQEVLSLWRSVEKPWIFICAMVAGKMNI